MHQERIYTPKLEMHSTVIEPLRSSKRPQSEDSQMCDRPELSPSLKMQLVKSGTREHASSSTSLDPYPAQFYIRGPPQLCGPGRTCRLLWPRLSALSAHLIATRKSLKQGRCPGLRPNHLEFDEFRPSLPAAVVARFLQCCLIFFHHSNSGRRSL